MKVEKIIFMQTFPTGQYANQRLGIEIDISDIKSYSDIIEHFQYAKNTVQQAFDTLNPGIKITLTPEPYNQPPPVINRKIVEKLEIDIDNSKTLEELETYKMDAINHGIYKHWGDKNNELSKQ